ncbi:meiosis inhibitor protein 1 [Salarias fasciatus]|uniref:meiosis inhibitor protein 1 n=1 Tax=Salarias fasciatus TaxID=181472 RepID=UPI0011764A81|nr:meiosis inhibitor protein 1 [Salarias fasciatus]
MTSGDIIYEKIHFRHDPKWSGRSGAAEGGGLLLCVACVIEMIQSPDVALVRKSFALSGVSALLKCSPGTLRELLQQDQSVCRYFTASLLGMLQTVEDPATLEKVEQVLVQLLVELQSEQSLRFILDDIHKQLADQFTSKRFLPTFNFLGGLVKTVPHVANILVTHYVPFLDQLCSALLYPDEALRTSVLNVWIQLFGTPGGSAVQSLPSAIRDSVCVLLLHTLANASSPQLIGNCLGLLWQLLQLSEAVSVLMNCSGSPIMCDENQDVSTNNSQILGQNQEQQRGDHCPLPLVLKKLLLSGDEILQVTSAKCIASVLAHSPSQYSAPFIKADIPEFLFDRLACSSSDVLLWSVYTCLLLMTEDPLFFSQCHSVYGIECLVRSLQEALKLTNPDVARQGLQLLTTILERQPPSVRLFPSGPGFVAVSQAVAAAVTSSCLLVATHAARAAAALVSRNHQSNPVQYKAIEELMTAISTRFCEQPLMSASAHRRSSGRLKRSDPNSQAVRAEGFLQQALTCFQAACRLAEECASEPLLRENTFTAPYKQGDADDSLDSLCRCLLHLCDSVWIPTVTRMLNCAPSAKMLQPFYAILAHQFTLLPSLMPIFASKLAASGFYRLAMEHKALLCAENRNPELDASCCGFLQKLSMSLVSHSDPSSVFYRHDVAEVENMLLCSLPVLCCHPSDWSSLLCDCQGPKVARFCLVIMLCLAFQHGDRLLPDQTVFSSVMWLLHSVQEEGDCSPPRSVLRSALYLLAVTQDRSPGLDGASLNCISKTLASCQTFSALYFHHPALLHFICRYPELAEKFGPLVLELWLAKPAQPTDAEPAVADSESKGGKRESEAGSSEDQQHDTETVELLSLMEKHPAVILTLLDMICSREAPLAQRVQGVLEVLLQSRRGYEADLCKKIKLAILRALQRIHVDNIRHCPGTTPQGAISLPLLLKLLCVTQASDLQSSSLYSNMEGVHFKLLYHVNIITGRLKPTNTESLLPAFSYLYCCLSLSPERCTDRAVPMLLSNTGLMNQLQGVISSTSTSSSSSSSSSSPSLSPSGGPPLALLCCCHLLLSSLIALQHVRSTQVCKSISWSLDTAVQQLLIQKRQYNSLLLVSYLRLLQALLDADMASAVVQLSTGPDLVGPRPLGVEDGALYPLGSRGAQHLSTVLHELLLQKHELLLRASVNCLGSLLGFLQRKSPTTAKFVVCQTWSDFFFLDCLLSSGESSLLHPANLRLITLLLQDGGTAALEEPDLLQVVEAAERRGVKELSREAALTLRLLLTQVQNRDLFSSEGHKQRVKNLMEALEAETPFESCSPRLSSDILRVEDVSICLCDFTLAEI